MTKKSIELNKDNVIQNPKDQIIDARIVELKLTTWAEEILDKEVLAKFDEPEQQIVKIYYEAITEDGTTYNNNECYAWYDNPHELSKLGKFITKYGEFKEGINCKVHFNSKGESKLDLS